MSKRKVTFSCDAEENAEEPKSQRLEGENSLDSDEDNENSCERKASSADNVLTEEDIEGQEEETIKSYGEIKITPFNLKEEMEEGHFDAEGNYIPDKDDGDVKDQWLEGIDWSKVDDKDGDEVALQTNWDDEIEQISDREKVKVMKDILCILQPGETALVALRRLGGARKNRGKNSKGECNTKDTESANEKKKLLLKLTELVDLLLQQGDFEIYNKTFEKLSYQIKQEDEKFADHTDGDDDDDDDELEKAFAEGASDQHEEERNKCSAILQTEVMWEYKWKDNAEAQIYGPYSNSCMQSWSEQGFFKDGAFCRKFGSEGSFYDSKRIDFELYE